MADQRGAGDAAVRDTYLAAKQRHIDTIERARRLVVEGLDNTGFAVALVDIDETMRGVLTDDR